MRSEAVAESASLVGQCFAEQYELEARIGCGVAGETYRARDVGDGRAVVVKVFHEDVGTDAVRQRQFELEMSKLAGLEHPSVPATLAFGVHAGRRFVVREWLEGETLAERLSRGALSLEPAMTIARQVLATLTAVHAAKLLHRDLHPGNVFLESRKHGGERVKLLDFAPLADEKRTASPFQPPEGEAGEALDARSDVFAVGALVSAMLRSAVSDADPASPTASSAAEERLARSASDAHSAQGALASAAVVAVLSAGPAGAATAAMPADAAPTLNERATIGSATATSADSAPRGRATRLDDPASQTADAPAAADAAAKLANAKLTRNERATVGSRATSPDSAKRGRARRKFGARTSATANAPAVENAAASAEDAALTLNERATIGSGAVDLPGRGGRTVDARPSASSDAATAVSPRADRIVSAFETSFAAPALDFAEPAPPAADEPENPLQRWIGRAMASDRLERFADAAQMLRELVDRLPHELRIAAEEAARKRRPTPEEVPQVAAKGTAAGPEEKVAAPSQSDSGTSAALGANAAPGTNPAPGTTPAAATTAGAPAQSGSGVAASAGLAAIATTALAFAKPRRPRTRPRMAASLVPPSNGPAELPEVDPVALHGPGEPGMSQLTAATAFGAFAFAAAVIIVMPGVFGRAHRAAPTPRAAEPAAAPPADTRVESAKPPEPPPVVPLSAIAPRAPAPVSPPKAATPISPPRPKPVAEARDPWLDPIPKELQRFRASALSGSPGDKATIEALRVYNRANPKDARGYLITARFYLNRLWRTDGVNQYAAAIERDPTVRGAPEILPALLECVAEGKAGPAAEALIDKVYGATAVPAIDAALDSVTSQTAALRLSTLSEKLLAKAP